MKAIPATLGYSILIDDEDFEWASRFRWYAHNTGGKRHPDKRPARRTSVAEGRNVLFFVHHIIKPEKGLVVDHINRDPWDNRRENLRICTTAQNVRNRGKHRTSNLYKGVYQRGSRFMARISFEGEGFKLGHYATAEAAAFAYDAAALYLHGDFACLNFPQAGTEARSPADIFAAAVPSPFRLPEEIRVRAIARVRCGEKAIHIAAELGISGATIGRWAADAGIRLSRGRPQKPFAKPPTTTPSKHDEPCVRVVA